MTSDEMTENDIKTELEAILEERLVHPVYQPIIDVATRDIVAFEALARGPEGSSLGRPDLLFKAARDHGHLEELDWLCRIRAMAGALEVGLPPSIPLFINVEPDALSTAVPEEYRKTWERAGRELKVVFEVTERALTRSPAPLIRRMDEARAQGWRVALDDVGADPMSLAMLPFLRPEVIKLDLRLVQDNTTREVARIVHAVDAEVERSGALVLAEGIETEAQLETGAAMGATLAQGWLFGRPQPLTLPDAPKRPLALDERSVPGHSDSPFEIVKEKRPLRRGSKRLLFQMSRNLEMEALHQNDQPVVLSTFQDVQHFTEPTRRLYARLADRVALVGAFGVGMPETPVLGVRGAVLADTDGLAGEWDVIVVGPHFAGAFAARDLEEPALTDGDRVFEYAITYDRQVVVDMGVALMRRILALET